MPRRIATQGSANSTSSSQLQHSYVNQASRIVAAYVSNNAVSAAELPKINEEAYTALANLAESATTLRKPAVPIKNSVTGNAIHCLEDGKSFRSIKRHLKTSHDLTPEQYRQKWGLAPNYPMVAASYSLARSELAKKMGLGRKPHVRRGKTAR
jgi:predicted transcriptional regulator